MITDVVLDGGCGGLRDSVCSGGLESTRLQGDQISAARRFFVLRLRGLSSSSSSSYSGFTTGTRASDLLRTDSISTHKLSLRALTS
ncbi:unnamed protein product, partial [Nesidiocoris tenuis]